MVNSATIQNLHRRWDLNINIDENTKNLEVVIRITKQCNERCLFCNTNLDNHKLSFEEVVEITNYIRYTYEKYTITISLSWWEPTLHPDIFVILTFLKKEGFFVKIQTNAVLFARKDFAEKFIDYENISFFISFHSHIPKIYHAITSSKLYNQALKWIIHIYQLFPSEKIELNMVANSLNISLYETYLRFIKRVFGNYTKNIQLIFSIIYPNQSNHKMLMVNYKDIVNVINKAIQIEDSVLMVTYEVWGYCQLPLCFYLQIQEQNDNLSHAGIDTSVGMENMMKVPQCQTCIYNSRCIGLPKLYIERFWSCDITPISSD